MRINSNPLWQPYHPLAVEDNDFLDHDSFVELTELHHFPAQDTDRHAIEMGQMSAAQMDLLSAAAVACATLTPDQKAIIDENLASPF